MKSLQEIPVSGKTVLVRVDFNVPLDEKQTITDDTRIRFVLPTLTYLSENNARVVVCSHLGRPQGKPDPVFSLAPVCRRLGELLEKSVGLLEDCLGDTVSEEIGKMQPGDIVLLENLRFHPGESANDEDFARKLGSLCEVYVNDAFAVSHRRNASVDAVTAHVSLCAAGFLLEKELQAFASALDDPQRPLAGVVGGAKVSSKLAALYNMLNSVDTLIIGGAMANTFLKARGLSVGASKVEDDLLAEAASIMARAEERNIACYLPEDVVVAEKIDPGADCQAVSVDSIPEGFLALDIGPATIRRYTAALAEARTILWNGPMGIFELAPFAGGTRAVARALAESGAYTVVGGGDTVSAVHEAGVAGDISYISTGGGAFLTLMEGRPLPGVAALERCG